MKNMFFVVCQKRIFCCLRKTCWINIRFVHLRQSEYNRTQSLSIIGANSILHWDNLLLKRNEFLKLDNNKKVFFRCVTLVMISRTVDNLTWSWIANMFERILCRTNSIRTKLNNRRFLSIGVQSSYVIILRKPSGSYGIWFIWLTQRTIRSESPYRAELCTIHKMCQIKNIDVFFDFVWLKKFLWKNLQVNLQLATEQASTVLI